MNEGLEEQVTIRQYLLGNLGDKDKMRQIEEKTLLDDDFNEILAIVEDNLIEEYLDDELTDAERERFTRHFLRVPENRRRLRLIQNLRQAAANAETVPAIPEKKASFLDWRKLFSLPAVRFAALALIVCGLGFGIWRVAFYQSDVDKGIAELRAAYRGQRPIQSRTTADFDYVPVSTTRGNKTAVDEKARERAQRILLDAVQEKNQDANHALGLYYLANGELDKALEEFNLALNVTPNDPRLHSDLGAVFLEMGKKALSEDDRGKALTFFDQSLKYSEKAINLNPKLTEAKFNRALCLELLPAMEQAKQAWREYLEFDPNSQWSAEAREHLQRLESQKTEDRSASDLERDFLLAVRDNNETQAWQLLSRNRELIQEKYLPQRLAISYLKADGNEKEIFLTALKYTGELENKYIGDPFAGEIARFYSALPENRLSLLKQAHSFVKEGYQLGRNEEYGKALIKFESAYQLFLQSGDIWEAELSRYSIAYYLYNNNKLNESLIIFSQITDFCRTKNYKWLQQSAIHWVAGAYIALRKYTQAKKNYQQALSLAEEIKDSFSIQRNLTGLANIESSVGRTQQAAAYMQRALEESNAVDTSLRQRWRNYYAMLKVMISAKLFNAAKFLGRETMYLAEKNQNPLFTTLSYIGAGTAYVQSGNYEEAKDWLWDGRHAAESMVDASAKKKIAAYSYLRLGHLERQTGNYESSLQLYNEAIGIYETLNLPFYLYEAYKGRLLTNIGLKNNRELEEQIPATLKLVEEYRTTILDEQERNSFFDTEQSVYDIAVEYEFKREKFEDAYNYAEKSNSRSLLDWLQKGAKISGEQKKLEILLEENVAPLTLPEIRQQMPAEVQILQYSVLEDKILIWVISKEKFTYTPVDISLEELRRKIKSYVDLVQDRNQTAQTDAEKLGRELYDLLIKPVSAQLDPARHICLIPNKFLFYLPFAALINPEEKPFLADFNFFYAPSANVFLFCTLNALKKTFSTSETFLGVGNPAFKRDDFDDLSKLPEAEKEVAEVAALYADSQILLGKTATKPSFKNLMREAEVIHFAGHYVVVHETPLSSYLLLAQNGEAAENSVLTNAELVSEKLPHVKLVVLSACQTGVEYSHNGEGLIGLSRTFLTTGVPLVVASQWKVDSDATAELMIRFHFYRRQENLNTTAALRRAQLEMLSREDGKFSRPYYWAAFGVFGGYARF